MKSAKLLNLLVVSLLLATFASGCKKQPKNITTIPGRNPDTGGGSLNPAFPGGTINPGGPGSSELGAGELPTPKEGAQDRAALASQTVYFAFDRSAIQASEQPKLDAVATYLKNTPNVQLLVEGHCDERGTEEYNRSLAERRAISAREYLLQKHGLGSERVTTTSFGEDRPASLERTEEGYSKNRRAEFVIIR
ncbi:MAG TPA: OmpA family protein [Candidatus Kapabacteria bacterium]|jgi:peptidoglycan-associated lipoprotein|nr:OmpA family protein [Candidatus Kapabacteria bacterium]